MLRLLQSVAILAALPPLAAALSPPHDRGPLFDGSTVVRSLDVEGYEAMLNDSSSVWLVDYYSSWCAHCRMFAPEWEKVGELYAPSKIVQVGAVDCNRHKEICTREEVHAYPSVKAHHVPLGSNEKVNMEARGRKKLKSVAAWVEDVVKEHDMKSGVDMSTITEEKKLRRNEDAEIEPSKVIEDDTSTLMKYNRLFDAGKAVMLALENSFFIGVQVLEGERYDAALKWVNALAASFPLEGNRAAMVKLADIMKQQKTWSLVEWSELIRSMTTRSFKAEEAWKPSETMAAIRLYMKNFFGCRDCRQHFMEANPESLVEELAAGDTNGPHAVVMWAWKMHNPVNKRLHVNQWPSLSACSSCYIDIGGPVSIGMSLIHEDGIAAYVTSVYGHEDKALFDEIIMTATYKFPAQSFNTMTVAALVIALVVVVVKTQRHRFAISKDIHMA
ncbi:hypothetical protein PF008_g27799 [Phytophthora fragariae]|uniref:Sulfhydryl oxidase n=1 Tax=Phytophthora fragariae TaxID=53985 RepID=A0A6G0QD48_9STRA|nr:hypothetical protein PF008_g27799 [Phytophthora fragariae]